MKRKLEIGDSFIDRYENGYIFSGIVGGSVCLTMMLGTVPVPLYFKVNEMHYYRDVFIVESDTVDGETYVYVEMHK